MGDAVADWVVPVACATTYVALALRTAASSIAEAGGGVQDRMVFVLVLVLASVAAACIALAVRGL